MIEIIVYEKNNPIVSAVRFTKTKDGWEVKYGKGSTIDEANFCTTYGRQRMCNLCPNFDFSTEQCGSSGIPIAEETVKHHVKRALVDPSNTPMIRAYGPSSELSLDDIQKWVNEK